MGWANTAQIKNKIKNISPATQSFFAYKQRQQLLSDVVNVQNLFFSAVGRRVDIVSHKIVIGLGDGCVKCNGVLFGMIKGVDMGQTQGNGFSRDEGAEINLHSCEKWEWERVKNNGGRGYNFIVIQSRIFAVLTTKVDPAR